MIEGKKPCCPHSKYFVYYDPTRVMHFVSFLGKIGHKATYDCDHDQKGNKDKGRSIKLAHDV